MTAGLSLIPGKTGAHRAPPQLLEPIFPQPANATSDADCITTFTVRLPRHPTSPQKGQETIPAA